MQRRRMLAWLTATGTGQLLSTVAAAHGNIGPVRPPFQLPNVDVTRHDGARIGIETILMGRVTAMQLIYTGCSTTCGLQGSTFAAVQRRLPSQWHQSLQLLSLSIDPLGDNANALAAWRNRFTAMIGWNAVVPDQGGLEQLRRALQQNGQPDAHSTQVYVFDRHARLIWRTAELPTALEIVNLIASA